MTRAEAVRPLGQTSPWASLDIDDPERSPVGDDVVALVDTGTGRRDRGDRFTAVTTSMYAGASSG